MIVLKLRALSIVNKNITRSVASLAANVKDDLSSLKSYDEIPGPSSYPLVGSALHFLPGGSYYGKMGLELSEALHKKYGPVVKINGFLSCPTIVFLDDPEDIAFVYRSENLLPKRPGFDSFEYYRKVESQKCPHLEGSATYQGKTGLITDHGEQWKEFRQIVNPIMLQPKTVKLYTEPLDQVAKDFVSKLKTIRDNKDLIEKHFDLEMNKWALESIALVGLGSRIGCFNPDLAEDSPARQLIQSVREIHTVGQKLDFEPSFWRHIPTKAFRQAMKTYETQMRLSRYFINLSIENKLKNKEITSDTKAVFDKLMAIDENVALIMATDMLFAGVDTAANSMLSALFLLARNPEKQEKLRAELFSQDNKQTYMKACIKETIRIMPVVSGNIRETSKDYVIQGYHIPKNKQLVFQHQYLSVQESQYPRPLEYIPERWLVEKEDPLYHGNAHPFAMGPFGFGTRQCIGQRIAQLEFECFLTNMIKNFRVEWYGSSDMKVEANTLNFAQPPFYFKFHDL